MWETIHDVLMSPNAGIILIFMVFVIILGWILVRTGKLTINTKSVTLGAETKERDIIRQQIEWAHTFIMGLESEIIVDRSQYNGYYTKYILERIYDEVVNWITFNHINLESDYISIKQQLIKSLLRGMDIRPEFRSKEFEKKVDKWTEEIIQKLALIRQMYK